MSDEKPKTAIEFVEDIARRAARSVHHHNRMVREYYHKLELAKQLMKRAGFENLPECTDADDDSDENFETVEEYAADIIYSASWHVRYHEVELVKAHNDFANIQIMLARGNYTEIEIAIDDVGKDSSHA